MGVIEIEGMEFYAYHGHFSEEQIVGNLFVVDLTIITDCSKAAISDNLNDALNYMSAYLIIKEQMQINSNLLEHVAGRILSKLYDCFDTIDKAKVKISKLNPPMGGQIEKVSVTLER